MIPYLSMSYGKMFEKCLCFTSIVWVQFSHKSDKFRFLEVIEKLLTKKDLVPHLNISNKTISKSLKYFNPIQDGGGGQKQSVNSL